MTLVDAERGGVKAAYSAGIEIDGVHVGYVQKERGDKDYKAFASASGKQVSNGRTLRDVKDDIAAAAEAGELEIDD